VQFAPLKIAAVRTKTFSEGTARYPSLGLNVTILRADMFHQATECMVNAANSDMKHAGGIA